MNIKEIVDACAPHESWFREDSDYFYEVEHALAEYDTVEDLIDSRRLLEPVLVELPWTTEEIVDIFKGNIEECENAFYNRFSHTEFDSIHECISTAVKVWLASRVEMCLTDLHMTLEENFDPETSLEGWDD